MPAYASMTRVGVAKTCGVAMNRRLGRLTQQLLQADETLQAALGWVLQPIETLQTYS